jgi:hypothetical protein
MPSTPIGIKFAPPPPGFTHAVAGALTIWARPVFETVGLNPLGKDPSSIATELQFSGVGGRKDVRQLRLDR